MFIRANPRGVVRKQKQSAQKPADTPSMTIERLEQRSMLSASPFDPAPPPVQANSMEVATQSFFVRTPDGERA